VKQALLVFAILGLLAWVLKVALLFLLPQLAQSPAYVTLATTDGYLEWILPLLGVIVAILGTVRAARDGSQTLVAVFVTLGALVVVLLVGGFFVALLAVFSYDQTLETIATIAVDVGMLFPVVVFVTALIYALRPISLPGKA
jgi:hypothetical protein